MMMNDWDYDEMPSMWQCQGEKNMMRKEGLEGGWIVVGKGTVEYGLGKGLMEVERGVVRHC